MWGMCLHAGRGDTELHNRKERTPPITLALTKEAEAVVMVVVMVVVESWLAGVVNVLYIESYTWFVSHVILGSEMLC